MELVQPELLSQEKSSAIKFALDKIFPEQLYEDKDTKIIRALLGESSSTYSTEDLNNIISEMQFLITTWLDEYERSLFDGLTLNELLHEKGGA